jgi:predicted nucleic acid-binding Zn ribbon protein
MEKIVSPRKDCEKCGHVVEPERRNIICDTCGVELQWNDRSGYPFQLSFVGKYDAPEGKTEDAQFCSIQCGINWIIKGAWNQYDTENHFFSCYLHKHELEVLQSSLTLQEKSKD